MTTRVNLDDLARGTSHMYTVNVFGDCGADYISLAGSTLHMIFRKDKCSLPEDAEMLVSHLQPENEETCKGTGHIPVTNEDSDIPEGLYHHSVVLESPAGKKHMVIYGRIKIVAGCPL